MINPKIWQDSHLIWYELKIMGRVLLFAIVFTLLAAILEASAVGLIGSLLQGITTPNQTALRTTVNWFDDWFLGVNANPNERIYRISGIILVTVWLRSLSAYLGRTGAKFCEIDLIDRLRRRIFQQFQDLNLSYYSQSRTGELIHTFTDEVAAINQAFNEVINFFTKSCIIFAYMLVMVVISWQLTLITLMLFALLAAGLGNFIRHLREISFDVSRNGSDTVAIATELVTGIRTVQASWSQEYEQSRFHRAATRYVNACKKGSILGNMVLPLAEAAATTILLGIIIVAMATVVSQGQLHAIELLAFLFALFRLLPIIAHMNSSWSMIAMFAGSLGAVNQLLRTDDKPYIVDGTEPFASLKHHIEIRNVDFSYGDDNLVLQNVTLKIERGQTVALVGASGSGKTTLADLLIRFYDPTSGNIYIDGVNLKNYRLGSLRQKMAIVSQDTFIFNATVRENIAYGLENIDDAAIIAAAVKANAGEFIFDLPEKFQTRLGERGVRLSGGQRQRIAIARALLRNPEILILDEATSALDSISERLVQQSLEELATGRTVIAIAHRLSTIFKADQVVVLEAGSIVEQGTYQELIDQRGKLWQYHQMQISNSEIIRS